MRSPEQQPDAMPTHLTETPIPAKVSDGEHTAFIHKNHEGVLSVQVAKGETIIFSASLTNTGDLSVSLPGRSTQQEAPVPLAQAESNETSETQETAAKPDHSPTPLPEMEKKPFKILGVIKATGELDKTPKQGRPVYRFQVTDTQNRQERRIVAFDDIATSLAATETNMTTNTPIQLLAWKHSNTVRIKGQERTIEEWYPQKIWYADKVIEKQKPKRERR